jgi:hypothetical protein
MKSFVKKHCNFCGEPMQESATVCNQCGWDRSQDGAPSADPADKKARIGVTLGLAVAYYVMFSLVSGADAGARPSRAPNPTPVAAPTAPDYAPVTGEAIALGAVPPTIPGSLGPPKSGAVFRGIKVTDSKSARIQALDALQYAFELPETDQKCQLVGQIHGLGGFASTLEVFLLTDDEYLFWHANPAAVPHSSWDTIRGSEASLRYSLPAPGTYHLVISNMMSPTPKTIQIKVDVRCSS